MPSVVKRQPDQRVLVAAPGQKVDRRHVDRVSCHDPAVGTDQFVVHCHANCASPAGWMPANEVRVSTAPFDLRELPNAGGYFPGDYVGFGTDGEDFLPFFTQSTATDPANEYFSRVSVGP